MSSKVQPIKSINDINEIKKRLHGRDLLLYIFGINSSLRISDILSLRVGHVRGPGGEPKTSLILKEQKTGKRKEFKFNKAILHAVTELVPKDAEDSDYLFTSKRNKEKPLDRTQAWRILKGAAKRAGVSVDMGTHTLRKSWAYHRYQAGADLAELMVALNHSSQRETLRYIGIEQENLDSLYEMVEL